MRRVRQLLRVMVTSSAIVLSMPYCNLCDQGAAGVEGTITVDNRPGNPSGAHYSDIGEAVRSSGPHTTIHVQEGRYVVDNPITLKDKGVTITGQSRERTIIRPKNAGNAIFKFDADHLRVENLTINAETIDRQGRGTFGVHIGNDRSFSAVLNTKILNTGASAIIGHSINDFRVDRNVIVNAGDDGIQLRGARLMVANNVILGYFDEAIDLGASISDIHVINNHVRSGRIGIAVNGQKNIFVRGNLVEDHIHGGFNITAQEGGAVVSLNTVRDSVETAYQLTSPELVDANRVEGNNAIGFTISNMHNRIIRQNVVMNAHVAMIIHTSTGNRIHSNTYFGISDKPVEFDKVSRGTNHLEDHPVATDESRAIAADLPRNRKSHGLSEPKETNGEMAKAVKRLLDESEGIGPYGFNSPGEIDVKGQTERDMETSTALAQFLTRQNPGFLSIEVRGNVIRSEITEDLHLTLRGSGALGIGIVRLPVRTLRRVSGTIFPVWHLVRGTEEIAIVTARLAPPGAHILFTEGQPGLQRFLILMAARFSQILTVSIRNFGYEVKDIYDGRRTIFAIAIALMGLFIGVGVWWRVKRAGSRSRSGRMPCCDGGTVDG
jgi:Periplasmic copper-binding protein (NosD)